MILEAFCDECGVRHGGHEPWCRLSEAEARDTARREDPQHQHGIGVYANLPCPRCAAPPQPSAPQDFDSWEDMIENQHMIPEAQPSAPQALDVVTDVIMSEPAWPRPGAIRRRAVMEKIRARLSRLPSEEEHVPGCDGNCGGKAGSEACFP